MQKRLTIALAAVVLAAAATSLAVAGSYQRSRAQVTPADALPAYEILNGVRSLGFKPTTQALRRGPYYVLHAIDRRGVEVRVVADAQLGDIVSVAPVLAPRFNGGPRIIHVPQPGERDDRAGTTYENDDNSAADDNDDADADQTPPPRRPPVRRPYQRMEAPPARASVEPPPRAKPEPKPEPKPLGPPRTVLSAPPPPATSLTPIYPTPKFDTKIDPAEKFSAPEKIPAPPPSYTPPAAPRG